MDIEKLKLTYPEMLAASNVPERSYIRVDGRQIADAQLAKALWGLVDYMRNSSQGTEIRYFADFLEDEIKAAAPILSGPPSEAEPDECDHCHGSGYCSCEGDEQGYHDGVCPFCNGSGQTPPLLDALQNDSDVG